MQTEKNWPSLNWPIRYAKSAGTKSQICTNYCEKNVPGFERRSIGVVEMPRFKHHLRVAAIRNTSEHFQHFSLVVYVVNKCFLNVNVPCVCFLLHKITHVIISIRV